MTVKLSDIDLSVSGKYNLENLSTWSETQVNSWICDIGFPQYSNNFLEHNITGEIICDVNHDHLTEMGIEKVSDRLKLVFLLKRLLNFKQLQELKKNQQKSNVVSASSVETRGRRLESQLAISTSPGTLRVSTHVSSNSSILSMGPGKSSLTSGIVSARARQEQDSFLAKSNGSDFKRNQSSSSSKNFGFNTRQRLIRVITEDDHSRILDIAGITSLKQLYTKILQNMSVDRLDSSTTDWSNLDRDMDKWTIHHLDKRYEGKAVINEEVSFLGGNPIEAGADAIPKFLFRRKLSTNAKSSSLATKKKGKRKYAKLENFFGEKISIRTPASTASISAPKGPTTTLQPLTSQLSPAPSSTTPTTHSTKLKSFFGDRPPSEMIAGNLTKFFPSVENVTVVPSSKPQYLQSQLEKKPTEKITMETSGSSGNITSAVITNPLLAQTQQNVADQKIAVLPKSMSESRDIKWAKGALIGTGSFGNVFMGLDTSTGEILAVKQVGLPESDDDSPLSKVQNRRKQMLEALHREIILLKELEHPNIVRYLGSESTEHHLNIFLEYVPGGSIVTALANYGIFEEQLIRNYVKQIISGLCYLHEKNIVHRDIKGANILVDNKGTVKITDFGISKKYANEKNDRGSVISLYEKKSKNRTSALQGSVFWMSPEVVKHYHYTKKSDVWSLGCVILEMLTGKHPWPDLSQMSAIYKIGLNETPEIPVHASENLRNLVEKCFIVNYKDRPTADELLECEYLKT